METTAAVDRGRSEETGTPPDREQRTLWRPDIYFPIIAGAVFLTVWEVVGRAVNPILFAPPSRVAGEFWDMLISGRLLEALLTTMNALTVGYLLSVVVGLVMGVILGRWKLVARVLEPYIDAVYATPRVVIVPLVILWFGVGYVGRVFIIWLGTVIPIILNTAIGVRNARQDLIEVARSFGANERELARHVVLPGSVPYIVAGLRIAAGRALVGVIVAEIFLDLTGLGGIIQLEAQYFRTARMLVALLVIGALGTLLIGGLGVIERRFSSWRETPTA